MCFINNIKHAGGDHESGEIPIGRHARACRGGQGLSGAPARAAVATFGVSGTMTPTLNAGCSPTCTLGGDIMFDNSAGAPHMGISADVTVTGFSPSTGPFTGFAGISAISGLTQLTIDDASGDFVDLVFSSPTAGSLVGYTGGLLDTSTFVETAGLPPSRWDLISGSLIAQTAVPEPPLAAASALGADGPGRPAQMPPSRISTAGPRRSSAPSTTGLRSYNGTCSPTASARPSANRSAPRRVRP